MKLLLDNIIFSLQKMGGISVVWENIIMALHKSDIPYECWEYSGAKNNIVRKEIKSFNHLFKQSRALLIERYINPIVRIKERFIFHSSYYRICLNHNAINITTVHDFTYEKFCKGLSAYVHKIQKNYAIRHSDIIVCISNNTKKDLLEYLPDIDPRKIRVIYNGVSNDYHPVKTSRWNHLGDYVVFVGSRQPYKQFDFTVRALKDTTFKLVIVGGELNEKERVLIHETLGEERYYYTGFLANAELNELYNQAFCLSYPSVYEGFGIPVLEAQRAGCPVIAYNASSIPEIIGDRTLLMNNLSIDEFHSKLQLLKNNVVRNTVIEAGLRNSHQYSWEKMGHEYIELYKELMTKYS